MKTFFQLLSGLLAILVFSGCPTPVDIGGPFLSSEKEITSFSIVNPSVTGTITGNDIYLTIPHGTNVTNLIARFTYTGKEISIAAASQVSGTTANDYTNPLIYIVTAEDGSTVLYTVTVSTALPPTYTVIFETNGGSDITSISGLPGNSIIDEPADPTKLYCIFKGWYIDPNFSSKWSFFSGRVNSNITLYGKWSMGGLGPGGGNVFYDDAVGFDFNNDGTIENSEKDLLDGNNDGILSGDRYLEAAPEGWDGALEPTAQWGAYGIVSGVQTISDASAINPVESVGKGESNTLQLLSILPPDSNRAAQISSTYAGGGESDWFLPSVGELKLMYENIEDVGGFKWDPYWSSSEFDVNMNLAWRVSFSSGYIRRDGKQNEKYVRPIRSF